MIGKYLRSLSTINAVATVIEFLPKINWNEICKSNRDGLEAPSSKHGVASYMRIHGNLHNLYFIRSQTISQVIAAWPTSDLTSALHVRMKQWLSIQVPPFWCRLDWVCGFKHAGNVRCLSTLNIYATVLASLLSGDHACAKQIYELALMWRPAFADYNI